MLSLFPASLRRRVPGCLLAVLAALAVLLSNGFALAAFGNLDPTFDTDGKVTTPPIGISFDLASAVAIQPHGKLAVAGYTDDGGSTDFALARYNSDGSLDTSFDGDGKVTTRISNYATAYALAIQPDGKLAVAGSAMIGGNNDFALALYNADGSLDTSFDGDGKVTTPIGTSHDRAQALAIQGDGMLVLAGYASHSTGSYFALARYQGNSLPTISGIGDQTIDEDSPMDPLSFSVGDAETAPASLNLSASSSNTTLVPNANIVLGGSGADRTVAITPAANRSGSATITLTVTDQGGATAQSSFALTVNPVNDAPVVSNLGKTGMEDTLLSFTASDFSAQFSDIEGDSLNAIRITALPSHDTLKLSSVPVTLNQEIAAANLSELAFAPDTNWNGSTSFGWSGSDGASYAAPALATITLTAVNDAPSFTPGANQAVKSTAGAQTVAGWASGFSAGPSDETGQTLLGYTVVSNSAPSLFTNAPAIDASGRLTYTPKPGARGTTTIGVVVRDSGGTANGGSNTSAVRTFTISIGGSYTLYLPLVRR